MVIAITTTIALIGFLWLFVVYWVRSTRVQSEKLTQAVEKIGTIVELATSDESKSRQYVAIKDRVEACEQRAQSALATTTEFGSRITAIDDRLGSHLGRYYQDGKKRKEAEEEPESQEIADFIAAAQAVPVAEPDVQPTNHRRRRSRRKYRRPGG